ncbi:MAG: DUF501 domain-containing protein [Nitriliruptoraceae bacterium]
MIPADGDGVPVAASAGSVTGPLEDAIGVDPTASYARAAAAPRADDHELAVLTAQLGRPARGRPAVVHRCGFGLPTVARVDPRLEDGTPFPTVFWLTCPLLRSQVGRLEAEHAMVGLNQRLEAEPGFAQAYADASERYVAFRDALGEPLPGDPSAGGMPRYIKCLHVHAAHHLATGDNPVGAWTVEHATPLACPGPCVPEELLTLPPAASDADPTAPPGEEPADGDRAGDRAAPNPADPA